MKEKVIERLGLIGILTLLMLVSMNTGCLDTAHQTDITIRAYQTKKYNDYEGEYDITIKESESHVCVYAQIHEDSVPYVFPLENGDFDLWVDGVGSTISEFCDISFRLTDDTDHVYITILIPKGGPDDVIKHHIEIEGASEVW